MSRRFCVAVTDGWMFNTDIHVYDRSGWRDVGSYADKDISLEDVSCISTRFCAVVGASEDGGVAVLFDGTKWQTTSTPRLHRVACVRTTFCLGTGEADGHAISSVFNGTAWSTPAAFGRPRLAPGFPFLRHQSTVCGRRH